jgi:hypothetical protein
MQLWHRSAQSAAQQSVLHGSTGDVLLGNATLDSTLVRRHERAEWSGWLHLISSSRTDIGSLMVSVNVCTAEPRSVDQLPHTKLSDRVATIAQWKVTVTLEELRLNMETPKIQLPTLLLRYEVHVSTRGNKRCKSMHVGPMVHVHDRLPESSLPPLLARNGCNSVSSLSQSSIHRSPPQSRAHFRPPAPVAHLCVE